MLAKANEVCGTSVSYKVFEPVKNAFSKGKKITYEEVEAAVKKHPRVSRTEVIRLFQKECLADETAEISGQKIFRTHLISLVEGLEGYSGIPMCNEHNPYGPLADYDDQGICVGDIAEYFSSKQGKIAQIKAQINKAENN